jgi:3-deoxy-D-manno-octulosonic-acid transferase
MSRVADAVYLLLLVVAGPFYWLWRRFRKKTGIPVSRRLGSGLARREGDDPLAWIHAVSVGEVAALRGLVDALRERVPGLRFLITTTTTSGLAVAKKSYPDCEVRESPVDFSWCVKRYLDAFRPSLLVLVEAELWPNLLGVSARRGVPVYVVNARVSDRSIGRYRLLTRLWPGFLEPVRSFLVQSAEQVPRLIGLGVSAGRIVTTGNIKFDNAAVQDPSVLRREIRDSAGIGQDAPLLVAGSTHPGEELDVVAAFRAVLPQFAGARLLLAPRHVERIPEVLALLGGVGLETLRWSEKSRASGAPCILIDTIGELGRLYAAADAAFVGGSLRPIGGHNLLEPARFGIPMFAGPYLKSVRSLASTFAESGALTVVRDTDDLARGLRAAFSDRIGAAARGRTAQTTIAANQGAARRCAEVLALAVRQSENTTSSKP